MADINKIFFSPQKQKLIEKMQEINFGRITNLPIKNGEPVFSPETIIERDIKLHGKNGPRPERELNDFSIKDEVASLFGELDHIGNGTIRELSIKHGLPFLLRIWERTA